LFCCALNILTVLSFITMVQKLAATRTTLKVNKFARILLRYSVLRTVVRPACCEQEYGLFSAKSCIRVCPPSLTIQMEALHIEIFHRYMRPDQQCVSLSILSRPFEEVLPSLGLPQLSFSVPSAADLDLDFGQVERTDKTCDHPFLRAVCWEAAMD
jgi:hypothetical protein